MKFKKLTEEQKGHICEVYLNSKFAQDADKTLSEDYNVSERTVRNWARKLGLTGGRDVKDIEVHQPEVVLPTKRPVENFHHAKILIFDLETMPLEAFVWGLWQQNIGHNTDMIISDWFMVTWAAKWLFGEKIYGDRLTVEEVLEEDDSRIMKSLWQLIDEADIIVAHNLIKFDEKRMNTRFLLNGLHKPSPYQRIDTLLHAKKKLAISSNKLDYLGEVLGVGKKMDTGGFKLWKGSKRGDEASLQKMFEYNVRDITLLEDVYLALRPYIQPHPNVGLWITEDVQACPTCGSEDLEPTGTYSTSANIYDAVRCNGCGSLGRQRKGKIAGKDKMNLLMPPAR